MTPLTTSYEQSVRLKKLGFDIETEFYWFSSIKFGKTDASWGLVHRDSVQSYHLDDEMVTHEENMGTEPDKYIAAPTLGELIDFLGKDFHSIGVQHDPVDSILPIYYSRDRSDHIVHTHEGFIAAVLPFVEKKLKNI
jgi:hypothetical protein